MGVTTATQLTADNRSTCAVLTDGSATCWGNNGSGQLGLGEDAYAEYVLDATPVAGLTGVAELSLGEWHACARLTAGTVRCWGSNTSGQLGEGTMTAGHGSPSSHVVQRR